MDGSPIIIKQTPDILIIKRRKPDSIKTVKIQIGGIYHLLDQATKRVFTCDPTHGTCVYLGILNEKDEIIYRDGWETDVNACATTSV